MRRYEGIAERLSDGRRNHLLLNDHWRLDTRIPPKGLTPDPETDPITDRYALTSDGYWSSVDTVAYEFALSDETQALLDEAVAAGQPATVEVHVRVRYLINTPVYLAQLLGAQLRVLEIDQREYKIQRIDGLPKRKVSPSKNDMKRIRSEGAVLKVAAAALAAASARRFARQSIAVTRRPLDL